MVISGAPIRRQATPFGMLYPDLTAPSALWIEGITAQFGSNPSFLGNFAIPVPLNLEGEIIVQGAILDYDTPGWILLSNGLRITL